MCSKSNTRRFFFDKSRSTSLLLAHLPAHSLRLRLMVWYSSLLLLGLSCFALLVLVLASNAINMNAQDAVQGVSQMAVGKISKILLPQPPYWPLTLPTQIQEMGGAASLNGSPGVAVELFDQKGELLYPVAYTSPLAPDREMWQKLQYSNGPLLYNASIGGSQALVELTSIYTAGSQASPKQAVGVVLVAKSLRDTSAILSELQGLLALTGAIILLLFLVCGWIVVGYALSPLSELVRLAGSIARDTHSQRLGQLSRMVRRRKGGDEMAQVVDAFQEMLSSIENSAVSQRRFVADASHELRAPLTTIQGNLAFLIRNIDEVSPADRRTMLADAHGETLRLASLVDELLLLARADAGMALPAVNSNTSAPIVELDRTLLRLVRQVRRRLEIEITAVRVEIGGIEPVRVRGDEQMMRRIMVNLLDNAIKYTRPEEGRPEGRITVSLHRQEKQAVLRVSDNGIGIEPKDLPHIFERFYRADLARSREGTGLGLAIAQTLVEQLNGVISAESIPGHGSIFQVNLPLA